jgi:hypothetical protein
LQPTTVEALVIVALVLSPGYLFTQVARRLIAHVPEATDLRFLLTIITYGTAIHALAFPFWTSTILRYYLSGQLLRHEREVFFWAITVCIALPLVLGIGVGQLTLWKSLDRLLDRIGLGYVDRMPSAWDYVVREPRGSWVKIQLKDGLGIIGGIYGSNSVASLDPRRADVYLEETWQLDEAGNFVGPVIDSQGVWVAHDVIAYVTFFNNWEEQSGTADLEVVAEPPNE